MKAIRVHQPGGPDAMQYEDAPTLEPGPGEARVKIEAIGVNFIDVYHRSGQYKLETPFTPGSEAAGVVDALGDRVSDIQVGDRVAYAMQIGAYAEYAIVPAWKLVPLPAAVSSETGAAIMLQGMTAHYATHSTFALQAGQQVLIHAAAGGVGLLLVQIAKKLGAFVIGTVSTAAKEQLAREAGADAIIRYTEQDFAAEVKQLTGDAGVHVVYDMVGKTTWEGNLNSLRPRGMLVLIGQSSGAVPAFDPQILNAKGSLFVTRPSLGHYITNRDELLWRSSDLFNWIADGSLNVRIDRSVSLADAATAHQALEARQTSGKVVLLP